jgi:hypothetical protein
MQNIITNMLSTTNLAPQASRNHFGHNVLHLKIIVIEFCDMCIMYTNVSTINHHLKFHEHDNVCFAKQNAIICRVGIYNDVV